MTLKTIKLEQTGPILVATISRPEALNALNAQVMNDIDELLSHLEQTPEIRVAILTGDGPKSFVAGADIKEINNLDRDGAKGFALDGQEIFTRMEELAQPVIAAVNGFALGGGFELALACDFIVASRNAKFGLPECSLGIMPGYGGTVRLPRRVGPAFAKEMALTGGTYTAEQGMLMGFVNRVVEPDELLKTARDLAEQMVSKAPLALAAIKRSIYQGMDFEIDEHGSLEAHLFSQLFGSADQREGTLAFIEKRKPVFTGK